jgi:hypothetical protein
VVLFIPDLDWGVLKLTVTGRVGNEPLTIEARALAGGEEVSSASRMSRSRRGSRASAVAVVVRNPMGARA